MAVDQLSRAFVALADPTRRDIVARLSVRDATVGELAESYAMSMQAVSKHLKVLEEAGLVSRSRDAQRRPCHLEPQVFDLMTSWIERYRRQAEERFGRLDAVLAAMADDETPGPRPDRKRHAEQTERTEHSEHTGGSDRPARDGRPAQHEGDPS
ncbi:ArsR/SmtB family transcription factor [Kitasatospora sp. NPDC004745]|uniref:ArsR/SmtB family transcription factor n=1 Tax=Kitasatospora sp. NPDC004745 TaxID=3364019 RepID=UPI003680C345